MRVRAIVGGNYTDPVTGKSIRFNPGAEVEMPDQVAEVYLRKFGRPIIEPVSAPETTVRRSRKKPAEEE